MIDIVILCPVEVEFKKIRKILTNSKSTQYKKLSFDFGQIKAKSYNWNIAVIEPDLNLSSFGLKVNEAISTLNPKYVFLAGIAGGIKDPKIGDIVIGTKAYFYEGGKETNEGFVARPRIIENKSNDLLTIAKRITREIKQKNTEFHFGAIASGNKVLASLDSQSIEIIKKHYNDTQALEMESYEFALAASRLEIPYLNIRGISDLIDGKTKSDSDGHQETVSEEVAIFLYQLICNLPAPIQKVYYSDTVNFATKRFSLVEARKMGIATLSFKDNFIEVKEEMRIFKISTLESVEHIKMGGDLKPNWVRITFFENGKLEERFYSEKSSFGSGNWIGGSEKLLVHFENFKKKQLVLNYD
jgi:nucleoside phosphorylase